MFKAIGTALSRSWTAFKSTLKGHSGQFDDVHVFGAGSYFGGWSSHSFTKMVAKAVENPIARRSIDFVGDNMAGIPLKLVEVQDDGSTEEMGEHPILDLLHRPGGPENKRYTKDWLFKGFVWSLMGGGEWWLRGLAPDDGINEGRPQKLQLFDRSEFMEFGYDDQGFINGYRLRMDRAGRRGKIIETTAEETLHAFNYNPLRPERGLPILVSIMRQLELMEDADAWNKSVSENKGRVPGFMQPMGLDPTEQLSPEQVEEAQSRLNEEVNEARTGNAWKVLSGAYEPKERGITPEEAAWIESSQYFGRLIATGIGVDPSLIGDNSAQTYDNYRVALFIAFTTRIIPMLEFNLSSLNRWLVPKFEDEGQTLRLTFDPLEIDAIVEMLLAKIESLVQATNSPILTPDEARQLIQFDAFEDEVTDELIMKIGKQPHTAMAGQPLDVDEPSVGGDGATSHANEEMIRILTDGPDVDPREN